MAASNKAASKKAPETGPAAVETEADPFKGAEPVEGLEHLGNAIVDKAGVPSGSPANYEALRGITGTEKTPEQVADMKAAIAAEFPKPAA